MKLGLRLFLGYFLIVGLTAWFSLKLVTDELKPVVRQVSEEALVETAQVLALLVQPSMKRGAFVGSELAAQLQQLNQTRIDASIWRRHKRALNLRVYVTDDRGIVLFDSSGKDVGKDYSRWNDVYLTLRGQYGVRSSRLDPADESSTVMHVAAAIRDDSKLLGVLTVAVPNQSNQPYIDVAREQLLQYGTALLLFSLLIGGGFTVWLIWSLRQISHYALSVSDSRSVHAPQFAHGTELEKLIEALETMRNRLEGKAYAEQYVHTLTHELKNPLAAIQAATELLGDDTMPAEQRHRFLQSINEQSSRLQQLIQRLLQLARLEQRRALEQVEVIAVSAMATAASAQMATLLSTNQVTLTVSGNTRATIKGERFLIVQALVNLLDNAMAYASQGSAITLQITATDTVAQFQVRNSGPQIPDYALTRIGERFYSLPRPDGRKSSGLGLSFVREVMSLHGGKLIIQNHSEGVVVTLTFPLTTTPAREHRP